MKKIFYTVAIAAFVGAISVNSFAQDGEKKTTTKTETKKCDKNKCCKKVCDSKKKKKK